MTSASGLKIFAVRVRFNTNGKKIDSDSLELEFTYNDRPVFLRSGQDGLAIKDSSILTCHATGFPSEEDADRFGRDLIVVMELTGLKLGFGIDSGKTAERRSILTQHHLSKRQGPRSFNDIHGVLVYEDMGDVPDFVATFSGMVQSFAADAVINSISESMEKIASLTPLQSLAVELYNSAHFERTSRARLLTLITSVECLTLQTAESSENINLIEGFILAATEKGAGDSIKNRLRELKKISIGRACANLIEKTIGKEHLKEWSNWYDARSKLVHEGIVTDFLKSKSLFGLEQMAAKIILADISATLNPEGLR